MVIPIRGRASPSPRRKRRSRRPADYHNVGMTSAKDRLVITYVETRRGKLTGGRRFLDEMGLLPTKPGSPILPI